MRSITIAPPNSLIFVEDAKGGEPPDDVAAGPTIIATDSCIAVCCLAQIDGPTKITIGPAQEVDPGRHPEFDGVLETPSGMVTVTTVELKKVLEEKVSSLRTRVRIWMNRLKQPDDVVIGLGQ